MVELPQTTLWVAAVFFHRFYMRCSMAEEKGGIHHYVSSPVANTSRVTRDFKRVLTQIPTATEHSCDSLVPRKQDRGKLPKDKGHHLRRGQSCSEEP